MKKLLILLLPFLLLAGCSNDNLAPEVEAKLIDGTPFELSELRGQFVIMDFWATWCGPCLRSMPKLVELHEKYGEEVEVVTIAIERDSQSLNTVSKRLGMTWKYQLVEIAKVLPLAPTAWSYGVTEIPATFLVTPKGELISGMNLEQIDAYLEANLD